MKLKLNSKYKFIAKDFDGAWRLYRKRPFIMGSTWRGVGDGLIVNIFDLPVVLWKDSLYEIVRGKLKKPKPLLSVDAMVWVRANHSDKWLPRHFKCFELDGVVCWERGKTSHTTNKYVFWRYYKL